MFEDEKKTTLSKIDKSSKGSIDTPIIPLLNTLNDHPHYYTTSSCSGRIVIMQGDKKPESKWLLITHDLVKEEEIRNTLVAWDKEDTLWLRLEPMILHVACKTVEDAQALVDTARSVGFRRSGMQSVRKNIVEIAASEQMNTLIAADGEVLINENYIKKITPILNEKLKQTWKKMLSLKEQQEHNHC